MRIGTPDSASYRNLYQRRRSRRLHEAEKLCVRLDKLVARAEKFGRGTKTREDLESRAASVRAKLREVGF